MCRRFTKNKRVRVKKTIVEPSLREIQFTWKNNFKNYRQSKQKHQHRILKPKFKFKQFNSVSQKVAP